MLVVGARPNLVKMAPLVRVIDSAGRMESCLIHTGQHYDTAMSEVFFRDLGLRPADVNLGVGSGTHAAQTGAVMNALERLFQERRPAMVVTVGDVNSTLAAALAAAKAAIPQAHVEAGLRSFDALMPEEVNRVLTDRLSDLLFTHSEEANENLRREGVAEQRICFAGNVMIDSLLRLQPVWQGVAEREVGILPSKYAVVTLHRPANVDDPENLARIIHSIATISDQIPIIFPVHPRTRQRLETLTHPHLNLVEPLGYLAFLDLVQHARLVLTDSGGIQEESTVLGVPCLTFRDSTERPITVRLGTNRIIGSDPTAIPSAVDEVLGNPRKEVLAIPLWDGRAAERIEARLFEYVSAPGSLRLSS